MESKFKIIIMDVDGTLTNSQKIVTPKTKAALMKAQELGIKLILASGRPTSGLIGLGHELQMDKYHGLFVCYNGSKVVDCQTKEELFNQPLSIEEGKAVLEHMKKFNRVRPMIDKGEYMFVNNVMITILISMVHHSMLLNMNHVVETISYVRLTI